MKEILRKVGPDAAAVIGFMLLSLVYFFTPVSEGLVLSGHDNTGGIGAGQEIAQYGERTGETTRWTNALFSGMPTYQIAPRAFNFRPWLSVLGAIVWAFSSYFFIIIAAGHIWKVLTLAFIPPTIAGMVLCYRGKYLWGGAVTALFLAFQILSNHLQMTYYFLFVMGLMFAAYLVQSIREKTMGRFLKGTLTLLVAAVIACAANLSNLYHTYEYSKDYMKDYAAYKEAKAAEKAKNEQNNN